MFACLFVIGSARRQWSNHPHLVCIQCFALACFYSLFTFFFTVYTFLSLFLSVSVSLSIYPSLSSFSFYSLSLSCSPPLSLPSPVTSYPLSLSLSLCHTHAHTCTQPICWPSGKSFTWRVGDTRIASYFSRSSHTSD